MIFSAPGFPANNMSGVVDVRFFPEDASPLISVAVPGFRIPLVVN